MRYADIKVGQMLEIVDDDNAWWHCFEPGTRVKVLAKRVVDRVQEIEVEGPSANHPDGIDQVVPARTLRLAKED